MRLRYALMLTWTVGFALGCTRHRSPPDQEPPPVPVTLEVTNNNWADMVVYVVRGTQRVRVMTVITSNTESIVLRPDLVGPGGEVRIFAQAIGSSTRYLSPRVFASPGGTVAVNLETNLARSTVAVW